MALSAFDDKTHQPSAADLRKVLRRTGVHWDGLIDHISTEYAPLDRTWSFGGARWGWSLRLKQKKRTVLYMTPGEGFFYVGFALGEKAVKAAHESGLSDAILAVIDGAPKYAEGRGVRIEVRNKQHLVQIKKLAAVKMAN
jgi:hypothetical protein